jgi:hypothetical protein
MMKWAVARAVTLALAATAALVAVAQLQPARRPLAVAVWLLLLGALAVQLAVLRLQLDYPRPGRSAFDAALAARPPEAQPPAPLEALARLLALSSASALHAHSQLRARLRPIAADRLAWYRGVELDAQPAQARAALGEAAWALVRPDPGPAPDRTAPGLPEATLAAVIRALEELTDR